MPELVDPTPALYSQWRAAHDEWGPGQHEDGFGLDADDDTSTEAAFAEWTGRLNRARGRLWWILDDGAVAGGIGLRDAADPSVDRLGHIGYGIRPSRRGRGLATWALREVLAAARARGLDHVLIVCEKENLASARVIEHCGGYPEPVVQNTGRSAVRRYRIDLAE